MSCFEFELRLREIQRRTDKALEQADINLDDDVADLQEQIDELAKRLERHERMLKILLERNGGLTPDETAEVEA